MKIDVTQKRFQKTLKRKSQNKIQRKQNCYTCDKLKHFFRKCVQNKYKNKSSSYNKNDRFIATTKIIKSDDYQRLSWTACYNDSCYTHLDDKKDSSWFSKLLRRVKFLVATHRQSEVHDENSEKKFFIIILEKHENRENDRDLTVNALNKTIFEVNNLKDTIQKFVKATKYELRSESFSSNIEEEI